MHERHVYDTIPDHLRIPRDDRREKARKAEAVQNEADLRRKLREEPRETEQEAMERLKIIASVEERNERAAQRAQVQRNSALDCIYQVKTLLTAGRHPDEALAAIERWENEGGR